MKQGAVAIIDALGFRGVWQRHDPATVLTCMADLKARLDEDVEQIRRQQPVMQFESAFLSDTIAVALSLRPADGPAYGPDPEALSIVYVTDILARVVAWSARSRAPLAYRGAVTYGGYELRSNFILGPAVDEAARAHDAAQGALMMPSAREIVADWLRNQPTNTHLVRFDVPLKGGDVFHSYTVSPLVQAVDEQDAHEITHRLLCTFEANRNSVDVAVKSDNTLKHLIACYASRDWKPPAGLLHLARRAPAT